MGSPRGAVGARPPSHAAYIVALAGILVLLLLLCCYFVYFCVKRVKELSRQPEPACGPPRAPPAGPAAVYPVQPGVRDTATAMARLCKQLPAAGGGGGTVFPAASSPAALRAPAAPAAAAADVLEAPPPADKTAPPIAALPATHEMPAAR